MSRNARDTIAYYLLRAVLGIGSRLPLAVNRFFGRIVVRFVFLFLERDKRRMREHIAIAFPDLDATTRRRLVRKSMIETAKTFGEGSAIWSWSRERILNNIWGMHMDPMTNVVDVYIGKLRKKLDPPDGPSLIETVRGVGYRFAEVAN